MKMIIAALMGVLLMAACNHEKGKGQTQTKDEESELCFLHVESKDTVRMSIIVEGISVTGDLTYNIFEKDKNYGKLRGTFAGDTLIAEYEFQSEGITSVREVAFIRKGSSMIEGFGTLDGTGTRFASPRDIRFTGFELQKVECDN